MTAAAQRAPKSRAALVAIVPGTYPIIMAVSVAVWCQKQAKGNLGLDSQAIPIANGTEAADMKGLAGSRQAQLYQELGFGRGICHSSNLHDDAIKF